MKPRETADSENPAAALKQRFSPALFRWFCWYSRRYLQRHFHTVRLLRGSEVADAPGRSLLLYGNHASWWDPLVALFLTRTLCAGRTPRAPIDARMLARHRFFQRLGFFGIEPGTRRGAVEFLRTAEPILRKPGTVLWLTPQGRFADVRERPPAFQPGLGHLALRGTGAVTQVMAAEYVFWEEKQPEILLGFGEPMELPPHRARPNEAPGDRGPTAEDWTRRFEASLVALQDRLARAAIRRDPAEFHVLLRGRGSVSAIYDAWRRWRATWRGETFQVDHGTK
ncbi:MAG: acyltransferase [Verrucomicrobiales bacterium]|nr:acyltransferase [Verrucomicrobiales bacterium]